MDFEEIFGFRELGLSFPVQVEGFDGETFRYSVYFDADPEEQEEALAQAVMRYASERETADVYAGYLDVWPADGKLVVVHDLGGLEPPDTISAIRGLLKALDAVDGIRNVVINEGVGFDF